MNNKYLEDYEEYLDDDEPNIKTSIAKVLYIMIGVAVFVITLNLGICVIF